VETTGAIKLDDLFDGSSRTSPLEVMKYAWQIRKEFYEEAVSSLGNVKSPGYDLHFCPKVASTEDNYMCYNRACWKCSEKIHDGSSADLELCNKVYSTA